MTTDSTGAQWQDFAEQLVDAVRSVDRNHLLVVDGARHGTEPPGEPAGGLEAVLRREPG